MIVCNCLTLPLSLLKIQTTLFPEQFQCQMSTHSLPWLRRPRMRDNEIHIDPGLWEHFLIKLRYYFRRLRDTHGRTLTDTRSRAPSCFEPFPDYLVCAVSSQLLMDCFSHKRVLIWHNLRIVKLPRKKRKWPKRPLDSNLPFLPISSPLSSLLLLGKAQRLPVSKDKKHIHSTLHLWDQIQTVLILLLKASNLSTS